MYHLGQAPAHPLEDCEADISDLHTYSSASSGLKEALRLTPLPTPRLSSTSPSCVTGIHARSPLFPTSADRDPALTTLDSVRSVMDLSLTSDAKIHMALVLIRDRHPDLYTSLIPEAVRIIDTQT